MRPLLAILLGLFVGVSPAGAVEQEAIDRAVDRGVQALRLMQTNNGTWPQVEIGATPLAGLALLECGVPADDPTIRKAADAVRQVSVSSTQTYFLALGILFLDRLGEPTDVPLLESMVVRLLAGQSMSNGGWSYGCGNLSDTEVKRLTSYLKKQSELVGRSNRQDKEPPRRRTVQDLPPEIKQQLALINRMGSGGVVQDIGSDNSNTQFATLALWVARKHGLPVDAALARVEARFRRSQNPDGGWGYGAPLPGFTSDSTAPMTCAGLLGLTVGHGVTVAIAKDKDPDAKGGRDVAKDPAVGRGLLALNTAVGRPVGKRGPAGPLAVAPVGGKAFYFLWSLERVMVALDLNSLGGKDWYAWGAELLLASQGQDGTWAGDFAGGGPDTCFALLFLRRANLARDLTVNLRGRLKDSEVVLRSGGVGGDNFRQGPLPLEGKNQDKSRRPEASKTAREPGKEPSESRPPPRPPQNPESARLARELIEASPAQKERTLDRLREGKGVVYTEALAAAIPQLNGETLRKAREALAERLTRMKAETLVLYLKDEDREIRRAAALACAMKDTKVYIPNLIPLLSDPELLVIRAAHLALKELSGQTIGPSREAWQEWWDKQGK